MHVLAFECFSIVCDMKKTIIRTSAVLLAAVCAACEEKYGSPCTRFCPAEVYHREEDGLHVDFSNCLHCKTCRIKCPCGNIDWMFPQGGDGPRYTRM